MNKVSKRSYAIISELKENLNYLLDSINDTLSTGKGTQILPVLNKIREGEKQKLETKLINFWLWKSKYSNDFEDIFAQISYVNISSYSLTKEEDNCLFLVPKYVIYTKINLKNPMPRIA